MKINQRKTGFVLSTLQMIISTLVGMFFTPFLIRSLGDIEYGLFQLMSTTVGYLAILDMGMTSTVTQFILKGQSKEETEITEASVVKVSLVFYSIVSLFVIVLFSILTVNLAAVYPATINSANIAHARKLFAILSATLILTLMNHTFTGIEIAYEKYTVAKGIEIIRHVLRIAVLLVLFQWKKDAELIVITDFILALAFLCFDIFYFKYKIRIDLKSGKINKTVFRRIFTFSVFVLFQLVVNKINNGVDQLILGRYVDLKMVGIYSVALTFASMYQSIGGLLPGVSIPRFTRLVTTHAEKEEVTETCARYGRFQYMILMLFVTGIILYGEQFFSCWTKEYNATYLWGITLLIMLPQIFEFIETPIFYVMKAKEKQAGRSIILVVMAVINVIISLILIKYDPVYGCAIGTCISFTLGNCILTNIYYHRVVQVSIPRFYLILVKKLMPATLAVAAAGILINQIPGSGWVNLIIKCVVYTAVYLLGIYLIGTDRMEKQMIRSILHLPGRADSKDN